MRNLLKLLKLDYVRNRQMYLLFFAVFFSNMILSFFMGYPIISDEYNTLSEGVFLIGGQELGDTFSTLHNTGYYGWGYAILYSSIYHLCHNMKIVYHTALIFNSFFVALIPVIAYKIATKFFHVDRINSLYISCCLSFYPAYVIYSKYALNETILLFIIWPILYYLLEFCNTSSQKRTKISLLLGILSFYTYAIHGRGLAVLGIVFIIFIPLVLKSNDKVKNKLVYFALFLSSGTVIYIINSYVKKYIAINFAGITIDQMSNTTENFLNISFFKSLVSGSQSFRILYGFLGQTFYITVATLGFAAIAVVIYIKCIFRCWKKKQIDLITLAGTFCTGLMTATLLISVLFFSNLYITEALRGGEYYLYGRYNELTGGMLGFIVLIYFLLRKKENNICYKYSFLLYLLILSGGIFVSFRKIIGNYKAPLSETMVIGLLPFWGKNKDLQVTSAGYIRVVLLAIIIFIFILSMLKLRRQKVLYLFLCGVFLYSSAFTLIEFVFPTSRNHYESFLPLEELNEHLSDFENVHLEKIYVLNSHVPKPRTIFAFSNYSVEYMENIVCDYKKYTQIRENSLLISIEDENLDHIFEEIYYIENDTGYNIWGYGDNLKNALESMGYLCYKRENPTRIYNGIQLHLMQNVQSENTVYSIPEDGNNLFLPPESYQYGPYCILEKGEYKVDVYGKNLTFGTPFSCFNEGFVPLQLNNVEISSGHTQYYVKIPEFSDSVEFAYTNNSNELIMIDYIVITPVYSAERCSIQDADHIFFRNRIYNISDGYRNFSDYITTNHDCIVSWRYIRLNPNGEIKINSLPMAKGENVLILSGSNIAFSDINIISGNSMPIKFEKKEVIDTDTVRVYLNSSEEITVIIQNNTNTYLDFSSLNVRWCEESEVK